jgi:hypothetical protein
VVHPRSVSSPIRNVKRVGRIYVSPDTNWSLAEIDWLDDDGERTPDAVGCRWNGVLNDPASLGHPSGRGHPTWFIVPDPIKPILQAIIDAHHAPRVP